MLRPAATTAVECWACPVRSSANGADGDGPVSCSTPATGTLAARLVVATGGLAIPKIGASPLSATGSPNSSACRSWRPTGPGAADPRRRTTGDLQGPLAGMALDAVAGMRRRALPREPAVHPPRAVRAGDPAGRPGRRDYRGGDGGSQITINLFPGRDVRRWLAEHARSNPARQPAGPSACPAASPTPGATRATGTALANQFNAKAARRRRHRPAGWQISPTAPSATQGRGHAGRGGHPVAVVEDHGGREVPGLHFIGGWSTSPATRRLTTSSGRAWASLPGWRLRAGPSVTAAGGAAFFGEERSASGRHHVEHAPPPAAAGRHKPLEHHQLCAHAAREAGVVVGIFTGGPRPERRAPAADGVQLQRSG